MKLPQLIEALESCLTWAKEHRDRPSDDEADEIFFQNLDLLHEVIAEYRLGPKSGLMLSKVYTMLQEIPE